jgi:hypothetical protein
MKWIVFTLLTAAFAALGSMPTQARQSAEWERDGARELAATASQMRADRPRAPEVWVMTVKERSRRSPQFPWGPWRVVKTFQGTYEEALRKANEEADKIDRKGKNYQSAIDKKRIR